MCRRLLICAVAGGICHSQATAATAHQTGVTGESALEVQGASDEKVYFDVSADGNAVQKQLPVALHSLDGEQGLIRRGRANGPQSSKGGQHDRLHEGFRQAIEARDQLHASPVRLVRKSNTLNAERQPSIRQQSDHASTSPMSSWALVSLSAVRSRLAEISPVTFIVAMILSCLTGGGIVFTYFIIVGNMAASSESTLGGSVRENLINPVLTMSMADVAEGMGLSSSKKHYDFEVEDEQAHWSTRYWKWCTKEEALALGVSVQAPTWAYEGHERVDVELTEKSVTALMAKSNQSLDNRKDMPKLLWKLLRAECCFMSTADDSSLLLMVETIRLRVVDSGHILVQEQDGSLLHTQAGLPAMEKSSSQSPVTASRRLWVDVMKMPLDAADFIEDVVEDIEFVGYGGLRCIERVHVMAVKLRCSDPEVVKTIGLPEHRPVTVTNPFAAVGSDDDTLERTFKWVTLVQYLQQGGVLSNLDADIRGKSLVEESAGSTPVENLFNVLRKGGVDPDVWDSGAHKGTDRKIKLLLHELRKGKCHIEQNSAGIVRVVNLVSVRVWSPDRQYLLVDRGRKNVHGEEAWDAQLPGRKKEYSESLQEVALAMCEIVGLHEDDFSFPDEGAWEYFDYIEESARFKGLPTKYQKFFVDAVLEEDDELFQRMNGPGTGNRKPGYIWTDHDS